MEYCKLQIGCMIIVLYVACIYIREKQIYQMKRKNVLFETILAAGIVGIFFDGATAYTVNHLAEIPASVNIFLHLCFLSFLDIFVFLMFLYMYDITRGLPQKRGERIGLFLPLLINIVVVIVGIYLNQETPLYAKLQKNNEEMVMGFATLVENRDDNTGGHIRRTTAYVKLLAEELRSRGFYKEQLTKDYVANLVMAAPMHDVGKIAIPDAILQKPGKLTDEEFEIMKTHAQKGGKIIRETFGHLGNDAYEEMAYEVAAHHHEKWNGRGYPDGLKETEIPLCARVMAVADVFDAVSAKRCYRDAMPLDQCFHIIEEGRGRDYDPVLVDVFIEIEDKIRKVYEESKAE